MMKAGKSVPERQESMKGTDGTGFHRARGENRVERVIVEA